MIDKKIIALSLISAVTVLLSPFTLTMTARAQTAPAFTPAVDGYLWLPKFVNSTGYSSLYKFTKASTTVAIINNQIGIDDSVVAVDDGFIWTGGQGPIVKISKQTGQVIGTVSNYQLTSITGTFQHAAGAVALDPTDAWFSYSVSGHPSMIIAVNKATLAVDKVIPNAGSGSSLQGIAVDQNYIWAATGNSVQKIDKTTGAIIATIPVGNYATGVVIGGKYVWVANQLSRNVMKIDRTTNAVVATIPVGRFSWSQLGAIAADNTSVWVVDANDVQFYKIDQATDAVTAISTWPSYRSSYMTGISFDDNYVWIIDNSNGEIFQFDKTTNNLINSLVDSSFYFLQVFGDFSGGQYDAVFGPPPAPSDTTAPITTATLSGTAGQNGWYISNISVALSATDGTGGSGVKETDLCVDQTNTCSPTAGTTTTITANGLSYIRYQSIDNAGNTEALHSDQVKIDMTAPTVSVTSPAKDDVITASPAAVMVSVSDATSGTASVSVNGTAAMLTSGTAQSGVWTASVPVTVPPAAGSALTFTATATDLAGNSGSSPMTTVDDDGIVTAVDRNAVTNIDESLIYSSDFNDGTTYGSIASRGGWDYSVVSAATAGTIEASLSGSGSNTSMVVCGNNVQVSMQKAGDTIDITCGTDPATGLPTTTATAVQAATSITLREPQTGKGKAVRVNLYTGQTVTLGSFILPSVSNTQLLSIEVVDENDVVLDTGSLLPGQEVNIDPNATGGILVQNLSTKPVTLIMDGTPVTINANQTMTDQCPGVAGNTGDTGCPFANDTVASVHIVDQSKSGVCGTLSNGKPVPACTQPLPGVPVKVFDRDNADFIAQFGKAPKKDRFASIFGSSVGSVGSCATDVSGSCAVGEVQPGHLLVIAQMTGTDGTATYDGRIINFRNTASLTADQQAKDDSDTDNAVPHAGAMVTKRLQFNETIMKSGSFKYQALSQGQNLWTLALDVLGGNANTDQVKSACKLVAQNNGIGVPEWGIPGNTIDRELTVGTLIDISGLQTGLTN